MQQGTNLEIDRCPHCSVDTPNLTNQGVVETSDHAGFCERAWVMYACGRCGGVVTAWSYKGNSFVEEIFPKPLSVEEAIPDRAKEYLQQAIGSISTPAGSVMLAASSVDAMLKYKGLTNGSLYARINQAVQDGMITSEMADWAHEVRLEANGQRHADTDSVLPSSDDARKLIDFVQALGMFLFVLPARVEQGIASAKNN